MDDVHEIGRLPHNWGDGDKEALDELRRRARIHLRRERPGHTLQTTALVHEAYVQSAKYADGTWECRAQFFAFAGKIMRNILVNHALAKQTEKRGGGALKLGLFDVDVKTPRRI